MLLLLLAGCAASSPSRSPGAARLAAPDSASVVVEVDLRRSAELADTRGALRVFDQDLRVEYQRGGRGSGLDAGEVTLDGQPLERIANAKGVRYHLGRFEPPGGNQAHDDPWVTLAHQGTPALPAAAARIRLAPFPVVTQPSPGLAILRSDELPVMLLPPATGVWYRISLVGSGDTVYALDLGQGRWLFTRGSLANLGQGRARVLVEVESSCAECEVGRGLRATVSSRSELEIPVTLL